MEESPLDGDANLSPTVVALYGIWAHWADRDESDIPVHVGKPGFLSFALSCPGLVTPPHFTLSDAGAVYDLVADGAGGLNMEDFVAALQTLAVERFPHDDEGSAYSALLAFHVFRTPNIRFPYLLADLAASGARLPPSGGLTEDEASPAPGPPSAAGRPRAPSAAAGTRTPPRSPGAAGGRRRDATTTSPEPPYGRSAGGVGGAGSPPPGAVVRSTLCASLPPATARRMPYVLVARPRPSPLSPSRAAVAAAVEAAGSGGDAHARAPPSPQAPRSAARRRSAAADDAVAAAAVAAAYAAAAAVAAAPASPPPWPPSSRAEAGAQADWPLAAAAAPTPPPRPFPRLDAFVSPAPPPPPPLESVGSQTLPLRAAAAEAAAAEARAAAAAATRAAAPSPAVRAARATGRCCRSAAVFAGWLLVYAIAVTAAHLAVTAYPGALVAAVEGTLDALPPSLRAHAPLRVVDGCLAVGRRVRLLPVCAPPPPPVPAPPSRVLDSGSDGCGGGNATAEWAVAATAAFPSDDELAALRCADDPWACSDGAFVAT